MAAIEIKDAVSDAIVADYEAKQSSTDHPTLRASEIGEECDRRLWLRLRWALQPKKWSGRMLRLFETGHREEDRIIANLRAIGVEVSMQQAPIPPLADGMLTGSIDGVAINVPGAEKTVHLLECKTHNDSNWKSWRRSGVRQSHPKHFAQMQVYMHALGLKRALYAAHNKNTDDLNFERLDYDPLFAEQAVARAHRIVFGETAPPKVSEKPDYYACKACEFSDLCHGQQRARAHCRTCIYFSIGRLDPACSYDCGWPLDLDDQKAGCARHLFIPDLINGQQIDADEARGSITYKMPDGSIFVDGARQ